MLRNLSYYRYVSLWRNTPCPFPPTTKTYSGVETRSATPWPASETFARDP